MTLNSTMAAGRFATAAELPGRRSIARIVRREFRHQASSTWLGDWLRQIHHEAVGPDVSPAGAEAVAAVTAQILIRLRGNAT